MSFFSSKYEKAVLQVNHARQREIKIKTFYSFATAVFGLYQVFMMAAVQLNLVCRVAINLRSKLTEEGKVMFLLKLRHINLEIFAGQIINMHARLQAIHWGFLVAGCVFRSNSSRFACP
ncbi:hypothetical protein CPC08DRAFT_711833 [Agrocybe pediades]|nr:hypothetical protein CPC08DRAFT_711833 [Agrocybe pediades]